MFKKMISIVVALIIIMSSQQVLAYQNLMHSNIDALNFSETNIAELSFKEDFYTQFEKNNTQPMIFGAVAIILALFFKKFGDILTEHEIICLEKELQKLEN